MEKLKCKNCGSGDVYTRLRDRLRICRRCGSNYKVNIKDMKGGIRQDENSKN